MTTLVVGASGATGKKLVEQLLSREHDVKVIVRSPESLPEAWDSNKRLSIIPASILELNDTELLRHINGCDAIASCLGHNMSIKGMFGKPRRLVRDSVHRITDLLIANKPEVPVKFILMNTAGNRNHNLNEEISLGQKIIIGIIRLILPPHKDNEEAADLLRTRISQSDSSIEWVVVRPDSLVDDEEISDYELYPSPIRSAIFNPGKTSRINVGHFMADLIIDNDLWNKWKGKMPVIYNIVSLK